jgi:hypothetical protein
MNTKIQKLLVDSGFHPTTLELMGVMPQVEKFAQLVAKECADIAMYKHISTSPSDYEELDPYDQGCDDAASSISGTIRYTFGVL